MSDQDAEFEAWLADADADIVDSLASVVDTEKNLLNLKQQAVTHAVAAAHANGSNEAARVIRSVLAHDEDEEDAQLGMPGRASAPHPATDASDVSGQLGRSDQSSQDAANADPQVVLLLPMWTSLIRRLVGRVRHAGRRTLLAVSVLVIVFVAVSTVGVGLIWAVSSSSSTWARSLMIGAVVGLVASVLARVWATVVQWQLHRHLRVRHRGRAAAVRLAWGAGDKEPCGQLHCQAWAIQIKTYRWLSANDLAPRPIGSWLFRWGPVEAEHHDPGLPASPAAPNPSGSAATTDELDDHDAAEDGFDEDDPTDEPQRRTLMVRNATRTEKVTGHLKHRRGAGQLSVKRSKRSPANRRNG